MTGPYVIASVAVADVHTQDVREPVPVQLKRMRSVHDSCTALASQNALGIAGESSAWASQSSTFARAS